MKAKVFGATLLAGLCALSAIGLTACGEEETTPPPAPSGQLTETEWKTAFTTTVTNMEDYDISYVSIMNYGQTGERTVAPTQTKDGNIIRSYLQGNADSYLVLDAENLTMTTYNYNFSMSSWLAPQVEVFANIEEFNTDTAFFSNERMFMLDYTFTGTGANASKSGTVADLYSCFTYDETEKTYTAQLTLSNEGAYSGDYTIVYKFTDGKISYFAYLLDSDMMGVVKQYTTSISYAPQTLTIPDEALNAQ